LTTQAGIAGSNGYDEITQINPSALQAQRRPQANPGWAVESGGFGVYAGICGKIDGLGHHPHFIPSRRMAMTHICGFFRMRSFLKDERKVGALGP
jgi:hypothetical protein